MLALVLHAVLAVTASAGVGFGDALMREGDYFRAIGEYKRALFETPDPAVTARCRLQIARAYRRSAHYGLAVEYAASVLGRAEASEPTRRAAQIELGLTYVDWGRGTLGVAYFDSASTGDSTGFARLGRGLVDLQAGDPHRAATAFREAALVRRDSASRADLLDLERGVSAFARERDLSPGLATGLSLVVPGSGQVYSGHLYDGLQALIFVGAFSLATLGTYQWEHTVRHQLGWTYVGLSVTSLFHGANLLGAHRTAQYRNWKRRLDTTRAARERVRRYEPPVDGP